MEKLIHKISIKGEIMKKILIIAMLMVTALTQSTYADQLTCLGRNTTMKMTDINGQGEPNFVYVQVWSRQYERAFYADLYSIALRRNLSTVSEVMSVKSFSSKGVLGGQLNVNMEKKTFSLVTKNGKNLNDSFKCEKTIMKPVVSSDIGG